MGYIFFSLVLQSFPSKITKAQLTMKIALHIQVDNEKPTEEDVEAKMAQMVCSLNNREECMACGTGDWSSIWSSGDCTTLFVTKTD